MNLTWRRKNRANLLRRKNRRAKYCQLEREEILDRHPLPSLDEIKDALRNNTESYRNILRLALIMDNLALHHAPAYIEGKNYTGRTRGMRMFLLRDGYLLSRYATLMRFARLGKLLRLTSSFSEWDMSQATLENCPEDFDDFIYGELQNEFAQYAGMNFKQIYNLAQQKYTEKLRHDARNELVSDEIIQQAKRKAFILAGWR